MIGGGSKLKKILVIISILIVFLLGSILYTLKPNSNIQSKSIPKRKIVIWASSQSFVNIAKEFEKKNKNVQIVMKVFNSLEILSKELNVAESAGTPPDIAEVSSFYGLFPFIQSEAILPVAPFLNNEYQKELVKAITKRFEWNNQMWAIPLGYQIPVIYINKKMMGSKGIQVEALKNLQALFATDSKLQQKNNVDVSKEVQIDEQYPWYLLHVLAEQEKTNFTKEQIRNTLWGKKNTNEQLLPFYTAHLAVTQFVNGKGGLLISTTQKLPKIDKLIGNKFDWDVIPFPINYQKLMPNGSGLVIFKQALSKKKIIQQFTNFIEETNQITAFAINETMIPPIKNLIMSDHYLQNYRQFPNYQSAIIQSMTAKGVFLQPKDEENWNNLKGIADQAK